MSMVPRHFYAEIRQVSVHERNRGAVLRDAKYADTVVLFAELAYDAVADDVVAKLIVMINQNAGHGLSLL